MQKLTNSKKALAKNIYSIQKRAIKCGVNWELLRQYSYLTGISNRVPHKRKSRTLIGFSLAAIILFVSSVNIVNHIKSVRCLLPSNFLVWEATRLFADCNYCKNVTKAIILRNVTQRDFSKYAYSSKPIIVKNSIAHWKATKELNYYTFKKLYEQTSGSYESLEDGCQFLNFQTDLFTLKEVFNMPDARARNEPGQKPWYVGWGNCHPDILAKVRQYYSIPDFLPEDAEYPATENIFFGYEIGALDYIPRLMWQGQVKGNKIWSVAPVPECDHICHKFDYYVEPGDIVLLDTRLWYHATKIPKGQFSLTVQSEYG